MDILRVEYRPTYRDRVLFQLIHHFLSPITNGFFVLMASFVFVMDHHRHATIVNLIVALILYVIMWIVQAIYVAVFFLARRHDPLLTEHVMTLRDDGLFDVTEFGEWHIFWRGVHRVALRPGFVAIYIGNTIAFLIPKRAFSTPEAEMAFIAAVKTRLNGARSIIERA